MRGSDYVDIAGEVLPRGFVKFVVTVGFAAMYVTGNFAPFIWYVQDKAEGITQLIIPALQGTFSDSETSAP